MKVTHWRKLIIMLGAYGGLGLWLLLTNPQEMPIVLLMVPFALLAVALWLSTTLLLDRFLPRLRRPKRAAIAACVSGVPVFLLILGSINQLTWGDVVLVVLFAGFIYFYVGRLRLPSGS